MIQCKLRNFNKYELELKCWYNIRKSWSNAMQIIIELFHRVIEAGESCPMCSEKVEILQLKRITDVDAYLQPKDNWYYCLLRYYINLCLQSNSKDVLFLSKEHLFMWISKYKCSFLIHKLLEILSCLSFSYCMYGASLENWLLITDECVLI